MAVDMSQPTTIAAGALLLLFAGGLAGEGEKPRSAEETAEKGRASVVTISSSDRRGESRGLGSGFIVRADGVVATSFHVIGQGRPFTVSLPGGRVARPTAVLAVDRAKDLAVVRIDAEGLPALELGDSDAVRPGQPVLAVGSPLGFRESVAQGVVAQKREMEGRQLIQVSMPIEPGSSGSPLLDLEGRVLGVIAIKSAVSMGFAVPVNDLKALLAREKPMPIANWLTVGALDPREWQAHFGGEWRQRAGRLIASGMGEGFGGRTLCLSATTPPGGRKRRRRSRLPVGWRRRALRLLSDERVAPPHPLRRSGRLQLDHPEDGGERPLPSGGMERVEGAAGRSEAPLLGQRSGGHRG
jgi:hypothetical protein